MKVAPIRVASVPASHVYVRHLHPETDPHPETDEHFEKNGQSANEPTVVRLQDPPPPAEPGASGAQSGRWWPPVMLDVDWVNANTDEFDVFHIHFGFDSRSPRDLAALVDALRRANKPLVYTVHDLRNPHHETQQLHDAQLDVLINGADRLITLTEGAANEIAARWGRTATVIPHPHVVAFDAMPELVPSRERNGEFRVGVHVKSLRANMNPLPIIRALVELAEEEPTVRIQINGHRDVLEPDGRKLDRQLADYLREQAAADRIDLRIHDFFTDEEFWAYLASLDASVLPYRFGTHSGWLEACRDVGTAVIAPDIGYYADQGPVYPYRNGETLDIDSLRGAVLAAATDAPQRAVGAAARRAQRAGIARQHAELYRELRAVEVRHA